MNSFIYKISRHPQYLGWILWSYGLFLMPVDHLKKSWGYADSLPLLLTFMIIIAISLLEELKVTQDFRRDYLQFKSKTAFLFPLPKKLLRFFLHPLRFILKKGKIDKKSDVYIIILYYTGVLMILSFFYVSFQDPGVKNPIFSSIRDRQIKKYSNILLHDEYYRAKYHATYELIKFGNAAIEPLMKALKSKNELIRNNAIFALGRIGNPVACEALYQAYKDTSVNCRETALGALVDMECDKIKDEIPGLLANDEGRLRTMAAGAVGKFKMADMKNLVIQNLEKVNQYELVTFVETLGVLGGQFTIENIVPYLYHEYHRVQEAAIFALMKIGSEKSVEALEPLTEADNWEIRIYAKGAIKRIKEN